MREHADGFQQQRGEIKRSVKQRKAHAERRSVWILQQRQSPGRIEEKQENRQHAKAEQCSALAAKGQQPAGGKQADPEYAEPVGIARNDKERQKHIETDDENCFGNAQMDSAPEQQQKHDCAEHGKDQRSPGEHAFVRKNIDNRHAAGDQREQSVNAKKLEPITLIIVQQY